MRLFKRPKRRDWLAELDRRNDITEGRPLLLFLWCRSMYPDLFAGLAVLDDRFVVMCEGYEGLPLAIRYREVAGCSLPPDRSAIMLESPRPPAIPDDLLLRTDLLHQLHQAGRGLDRDRMFVGLEFSPPLGGMHWEAFRGPLDEIDRHATYHGEPATLRAKAALTVA